MVFSTVLRIYLFLGLASVALMPHALPGQDVPTETEPVVNTQPNREIQKKWQKKKKKKPTIAQSWKKVMTGDWASLNKYDNRNLTMSLATVGAVYTFYYYCLRSPASAIQTQRPNGQHNQIEIADEDNTLKKKKKKKQIAIPLFNSVIEENRVKRAVAISQTHNSLCGVYSAHNADAALTFIETLAPDELKNHTIDATLLLLNQHLLKDSNILNARLQANKVSTNNKENWTAQVCHSRKYNIYKKTFSICIYNGLAQAAKEKRQATQTTWEKFISFFFNNTSLILKPAEKEAISRIADVFTKQLINNNIIDFDTLNEQTFKIIYEKYLPPLDDPDAQKKYGVDSTLTAYNKRQKDSLDIALQQGVRDNLKNIFGTRATENAELAQKLSASVKGTNFSNDLSGNDLDSSEVTRLLETIDRTYTILAEDAHGGIGRDAIEVIKAQNPEAFDTNYKITVIDKTNANQAGYYRQAINEVRKNMYSNNNRFAHAFLIRQDYQAPIKKGDDTAQMTATLSANGSTHWTTLVVLRIPSGVTMINHYIAIDSLNSINPNNRSHQDIIEILEPAPSTSNN